MMCSHLNFSLKDKIVPIKPLTVTFPIVECLVALGYKREDIEASLAQTRYDDVHATYLLISRKNTDVSRYALHKIDHRADVFYSKITHEFQFSQPESDGSRSGSSLSLRNLTGPDAAQAGTNSQVQSPTHRRVHRSISATSTNPSRRASSGGETLSKFNQTKKAISDS